MESSLFKIVGEVAGIGGIALLVFLLLLREVLRKNIFPTLPKVHSYKLLRLAIIVTGSIAAVGVGAWVHETKQDTSGGTTQATTSQLQNATPATSECHVGGIVTDVNGKGIMNADIVVIGRPERTETTTQGYFQLGIKAPTNAILGIRVSKDGYQPWTANIQIPNSDLRITLSPAVARTNPLHGRSAHRMVIIQQESHKPSKDR